MINMEYDWEANSRSKLETLEMEKKKRDQKPLYFCKLVAAYPLRSFLLTLGCHLIVIIASVILLGAGYDLLPVYMDDLPLHLHNEPWQGRVYAWLEKTNYPGYFDRTSSGGFRTQPSPRGNIELYYEMKDKTNVFTKNNLKWIERLENELLLAPGYQRYCQLDLITGNCSKPISVLRYFDGTYQQISSTFLDPNFDRVEEVLAEAATNPNSKVRFTFFLGASSFTNDTTVFSPITRSVIPFGSPMKEFLDDDMEYRKVAGKFTALNMEPILKDYLIDGNGDFQFSYRSMLLWFHFVQEQALKDCLWAGASIAFIFCSMLFHTRSLWITCFAVMSVMISFIITNLIYNLVLRFFYIGFFHTTSVFIILGIGADDFFVFYDIWRNTDSEVYISVAHRLSDTYRKSAVSMLFTSLTTSVAFFSNAISPLLATRSFGIFSGLAVIVNYLSVIIFFPTVVIMYHTYFEKFQWPCLKSSLSYFGKKFGFGERSCLQDISSETSNIENAQYNYDRSSTYFGNKSYMDTRDSGKVGSSERYQLFTIYRSDGNKYFIHSKAGFVIKLNKDTKRNNVYNAFSTDKEREAVFKPLRMDNGFVHRNDKHNLNGKPPVTHKDVTLVDLSLTRELKSPNDMCRGVKIQKKRKKPIMARFFREKYFRFITHKYIRWINLLLLAGVLGFFIYKANTLKADKELYKILPDDHTYEIAQAHRLNSFVASYGDETLELYIIWGLKQNNMDVCQFSEPECDGKLVIDHTFDPNPAESQNALKRFCDTLSNMDDSRAELLHLRKSSVNQKYEIQCFLANLDEFLMNDTQTNTKRLTFPYTKDSVLQFMEDRPQFYNLSTLDENFTDYLEVPISYWLSNRYTNEVTDDFSNFDPLIGEEVGPYSVNLNSSGNIFYGNKIRYLAVKVNTTIKFRILGHEAGIPIRDEWEKFIAEQRVLMPSGMKKFFQTDSRYIWHWLSVMEMLIQNAIYGIVISVCLAFPILVIATGNIIVGALATFSLCCCTVCVIGVIPLGGWKLGTLESLNMCMIVGLSVDYVVHLAQAYSSSSHGDRLSRVQDMLDEMATSVFFGAITTMGATVFMFFTMLTFCKLFATFMFATIGFSLLFSMCMFTTLMGIFGLEKNTGNLRGLFHRCCSKAHN